jgi:hypothetical protein
MSSRHDMDARCGLLATALKNGTVPRAERKAMRHLLLAVYNAQHQDGPSGATLNSLSAQVDEALCGLEYPDKSNQTPIADELLDRMATMHPIKIRSAIRRDLLEQHEATWTDLAKRLDGIVDWFWDRCQRSEDDLSDGSAETKASNELNGDMEYVWGRRRKQ